MKTISVYDAVKLATPGPVRLKIPPPGADPTAIDLMAEDGEHDIGCVWIDTTGGLPLPQMVNAALLAHFFNHGPALLAMLEEFVKLYEPFRKQLDANETEILDESIALIAKASKVEIEE